MLNSSVTIASAHPFQECSEADGTIACSSLEQREHSGKTLNKRLCRASKIDSMEQNRLDPMVAVLSNDLTGALADKY